MPGVSPTVRLWRGSLDLSESNLAECRCVLGGEELERADRFHFPVHRGRFIAGRGLLRSILAECLKVDPAELRFEYSEFGKPRLTSSNLNFNFAHSEDRYVLAVGERPVGVDLEVRRSIPEIDSLASEVFSSRESTTWEMIPPEQRELAFLRLWTRKEAFLKGIGLGIAHHLKEVSVYFDNEGQILTSARLTTEPWSIQTKTTEREVFSLAVPFASPEITLEEHAQLTCTAT